jgi:hypothetical protein
MYIHVYGILTDQAGRVLLYQTGPNTLGIVGCPAEPGILPAEALTKEFRRSTGLIVLPVRLTGLYFVRDHDPGRLSLVYRCIRRGGEISKVDGGPVAGFFPPNSLPPGLGVEVSRYLEDGLRHDGKAPHAETLSFGLKGRLERIFGSQKSRPAGEPDWSVTVYLLLETGDGKIVWVRTEEGESWRVPSAVVAPNEPPWEIAKNLGRRFGLSGNATPLELRMIQVKPTHPDVDLFFSSRLTHQLPHRLDSNVNTSRIQSETGDGFAVSDVARAKHIFSTPEAVIVQLSD